MAIVHIVRYCFLKYTWPCLLILQALSLPNLSNANIYYVDATGGNDTLTGTSINAPWKSIAKVNSASLQGLFKPGDFVLLKKGESWIEELKVNSTGTLNSPITFGAYGSSINKPVIWSVLVGGTGSFTVYEDILVDHKKQTRDAFRIKGATNVTIRRMEIKNGINDGIDVDKADGLLIDSSHIHHFLAGSHSNQVDAHGVVATDTDGITIRATEIHQVSGDAFQTDPDRDRDVSNNVVIENSLFWTAPLSSDFNVGWVKTDHLPISQQLTPSENAIDTKMVTSGWEDDNLIPRMKITIRNSIFFGWTKGSFIANRAVFNLKEKIDAVVDRVTVYNCEIAFRLRGTRGNANVEIRNSVIYNSDVAIRAEDNLSNLKLYNSTFGDAIGTHIRHAGGSAGVSTWDIRNNAFMFSKPQEAIFSTNVVATDKDFVDFRNADYHLITNSHLIDKASTLPTILVDRDGRIRTIPQDVGAYELIIGQDTIAPMKPGNLRILP